ncbi:hypothetical protein ACFPES_03805 [Paenibacillus sp. GCM10023248]|uniref:hypothetical protein n=1 Tax=unclassified Paenibacillus TaxID=185978 RepID=UPI0023793D78|nr:hypothetical protein [Paenibacillus sp. MAHUQ-63]MDD9266152.1 hypothetical protein [Paenibacillus sp. MAHUQ-63]
MGRNIIWRNEWKRPYESIWSLIENIKISNWINGSELSQYINNNTTSRMRSLRNVNKLSDDALNKLKELTDIDFFEIKTTMLKLSKLERYNPLHYFHTHLCYCEKCIQYNYHSYLHQYKQIDVCPFHLTELQTKCDFCGKDIYFFNIAKDIPFTCKCGNQLYQTFDESVWKNWSKFKPILEISIMHDNYNLAEGL